MCAPFAAIVLLESLDRLRGDLWTLPLWLVGLAIWGVITFPGWFYPVHGLITLAIVATSWAIVGLVVGWLLDRLDARGERHGIADGTGRYGQLS